ncbi:MAG: M1 family metallopeptidase [Phycisphaerales bacterium]|nr:M1 family metallopeptidase [Phycisphaerales bacterium]
MARALILRTLIFRSTLAVVGITLAGCASTGSTTSARGAGNVGDATRVGAVDEGFRRAGGTGAGSIFDPIDYPDASGVRLGSGAPGPDYWQNRADYTIDVTLDPDTESIEASMRLVYTNNSPDTLDYLWLQLEQNLFRTDSTGSLSRTPGGVMKVLDDDFDGGYDIGSITSNGSMLDMEVYDTLARVELPTPIRPGQRFTLSIDYSFRIPPHLRRMGAESVEDGKIFEIAQWFPHICMYDDVNGWNTLPYLGSGEFYTNYGSYSVAITVPSSYRVAASGLLTNAGEVLPSNELARLNEAQRSDEPVWIIPPEEAGTDTTEGWKTWRFGIDNARTFAWAASDAFIWDACTATITDTNGAQRSVLCQSLYPKEATAWLNTDEGKGSTRAIKHSIEFYSEFLYPYQYPVMSNINGPEGGMEYPGIVFCGDRTNPEGMFGVTDHEVGHSWFPMFVGSDERRYMWQDEGFNTFINLYSKAEWKQGDPDIDRAVAQTIEDARSVHPQPVMTAPDKTWPRWVGRLQYRKPGLGLYILREFVLGHERFDAAFRTYINRWAFKHPQPSDFFRTMSDASGMDLDWFWRGWFMEPYTLDQAIDKVTQVDGGAVVALENNGPMVMPVEMLVEYKDGSSETVELPVEIWFATDRWRATIRTGGRAIRRITLDPRGLLPDTNRGNNTWN